MTIFSTISIFQIPYFEPIQLILLRPDYPDYRLTHYQFYLQPGHSKFPRLPHEYAGVGVDAGVYEAFYWFAVLEFYLYPHGNGAIFESHPQNPNVANLMNKVFPIVLACFWFFQNLVEYDVYCFLYNPVQSVLDGEVSKVLWF